MTLLNKLQDHVGGILRLKPPLYWYDSRSYDNNPGRICLILDAAFHVTDVLDATTRNADITAAATTAAFLLINGQPHWVWVVEADVEVIE